MRNAKLSNHGLHNASASSLTQLLFLGLSLAVMVAITEHTESSSSSANIGNGMILLCDAFSFGTVSFQANRMPLTAAAAKKKSNNRFGTFHPSANTASTFTKLSASASSDNSNNNKDDECSVTDKDEIPFPCLPSIGNSSFDAAAAIATAVQNTNSNGDIAEGENSEEDGVQKSAPFVGHKFELQYTCKICETRNSNRVSRIAYRSGVVIVVCKGCGNKHLIADNLGWSIGFEPETSTIEDYLEANGRTDDINRVSSDVFELERVLSITDDSGSIVGEDGDRHLE